MKSVKKKNKKVSKIKLTVNGFTPEYEERMIKEGDYAIKYGKSYNSIEELHNDILGILKK